MRTILFAALAALGACAPGGGAGPAAPAPGGSAPYAYVTNQGEATVSVIDMNSHEVVAVVDLKTLGFSANAKPHHVEVEPDGSHWYVSLIGENTVVKFDRANRIVGRTTGFEVPGILALHPTLDLLYVARSMSAVNPPKSIGMIRRADMRMLREVDVFFPRPHALAAGRDSVAFVASLAVNQLASVDFAAEAAEITELPGTEQHTLIEFAVSPDDRWLVGTAEMSGQLFVYDVSDPLAPRLAAQIPVGVHPWHPAFSPDGATLWVPNKMSDNVSVVDARNWQVVGTIEHEAFAQPHGATVSPDGRWVFISNNNLHGDHMEGHAVDPGSVVVIDAQTRTVAKVIPVGLNPTGLGGPEPRR